MEETVKSEYKFGAFVAIFICVILFFYLLAIWLDLNQIFWWFDDVMHFFGGVWVASLFGYLAFRWKIAIGSSFWIKLLLGLGFVALAGVLWEFHEFIADWFLGINYMQPNSGDTISDLFLDLFGGLSFLIIYYYHFATIVEK